MIARTEELKWSFKFQGLKEIDANRDLIDLFPFAPFPTFHNDDTLNLNYTVSVHYIGQICKCLNAIVELQKRGVCISVNEEELNHGHCLIRDTFAAIDKINEGVK